MLSPLLDGTEDLLPTHGEMILNHGFPHPISLSRINNPVQHEEPYRLSLDAAIERSRLVTGSSHVHWRILGKAIGDQDHCPDGQQALKNC